jgi:hypothetical protein
LVFFAVFGAAFFAVPHGPFDLHAMAILLFEKSYFKITQQIVPVNTIEGLTNSFSHFWYHNYSDEKIAGPA